MPPPVPEYTLGYKVVAASMGLVTVGLLMYMPITTYGFLDHLVKDMEKLTHDVAGVKEALARVEAARKK